MTVLPTTGSPPDLVYHYTNSAGLLGILSNQELWLGDVEFMNDAEELTYARETTVAGLSAKADTLWPADREDDGSAEANRAGMIRMIIDYLRRSEADRARGQHVYAACFCESGDLLSQWRGYAGDGGYAIGFRTDKLAELAELAPSAEDSGHFLKILYGVDAARGTLDRIVHEVAPHPKGHAGVNAWHQFMQDVLPVAAIVKHPSFAEEQEWRLLRLSWGVRSDVKFRPGHLGLIPYRKLSLPPDSVSRIVIGPGPHQDVRRAGVLQLLEGCELPDVQVETTASPFRV